MSKKILILHHFGGIGGAGQSCVQNALILARNYNVTVMLPAGSPMEKLARSKGLDTLGYNIPIGTVEYYSGGPRIFSRTFFGRLARTRAFRKYFIDTAITLRPDIIIFNSLTTSYLAASVRANPELKHTRTATFIRETFPENGSKFIFNKYKKFLGCQDGLFFISDFDKAFWNITSTAAFTLKNSVPDDFFDYKSRDTHGSYNVLFAGGVQAFKGAAVLREALRSLSPGIKLLVCGDELQKTKEFFGDAPNIIHLGVCSDMRPIYAMADCLCFPSTKPHQARPVFEAGAFSLPVIISEFAETAEAVKDGYNGLTVTPGNSLGLAETINALAKNPELSMLLGKNNYNLTVKNHTTAAAATALSKAIHLL